MLSGFTSRCTTWRACAYASASATSRSIARTVAIGRRGVVRETLRERFALDEPHRKKHDAVEFVHRENRDDVRMRKLRGHLRLAQEPRLHIRAKGELRRQHLERHFAVQAHVARAVHHGHSAAPDLVLDLEQRADRFFNAVAQRVALGHGRPDSVRAGLDLGLMRAISSATYTALSTSLASAIAWSATEVMCCQLSARCRCATARRRGACSAARARSSRVFRSSRRGAGRGRPRSGAGA